MAKRSCPACSSSTWQQLGQDIDGEAIDGEMMEARERIEREKQRRGDIVSLDALDGNGVNTQNGYQSVADNGLEGYDSTAQGPYGHNREDALIDQLDDRAAVGLYAKTPWL